MDNILPNIEKPLSPVLNKSRNNHKRALLDKKGIIRNLAESRGPKVDDRRRQEGTTKVLENKGSCIPVPIKESFEFKRPHCPSAKQSSEEPSLATPSAVLEFKNEILANCAKARIHGGLVMASGNPSSSSEGKIKRYFEIPVDTTNSRAEDGISKVKQIKRDTRHVSRSAPPPIKVETSKASGDVNSDFQRPKSEDGSTLNMLYENKVFNFNQLSNSVLGSVTTDSNEINNFQSNTCSTVDSHVTHEQNYELLDLEDDLFNEEVIEKNFGMSQLNYNIITDESNSVTGKDKGGSKKELDLCTQETNILFSNFNQKIKTVENAFNKEAGECSSKSTIHINVTKSILNVKSNDKYMSDDDFYGYTPGEIDKFENRYKKYKCSVESFEEDFKMRHKKKSKKHTKNPEINFTELHNKETLTESGNQKLNDKTVNEAIEAGINASKKNKNSTKTQLSPIKVIQVAEESLGTTYNNENKSRASPNLISLPNNNKLQIHIKNCQIEINVRPKSGTETNNNELFQKQIDSSVRALQETQINKNTPCIKEPKISPKKLINVSKQLTENCDTKGSCNDPVSGKEFTNRNNGSSFGFAKASGKSVQISEKYLEKAKKNFQDDLFADVLKPGFEKTHPKNDYRHHKLSGSRKSLQFTDSAPTKVIKASDKKDDISAGFSLASGRNVNISSEKLKKAAKAFADLDDEPKFGKLNRNDEEKTACELIEDAVQSYDTALEKFKTSSSFKNKVKTPFKNVISRPNSSKKRLGMWTPKSMAMSKEKSFFKELELKNDCNIFNNIDSPLKTNQILNNTPNRLHNNSGNPQLTKTYENTSTPKGKLTDLMSFNELTPIKIDRKIESPSDSKNSTIIFHEKSCSDFEQLQNDIEKEYDRLKKKLKIVEERKLALDYQKNVIENGNEKHRRPKVGVLTRNKQKDSEQRVPLQNLCFYSDKNIDYFKIDTQIIEINPKNAERIHFNISGSEKAVITTLDGAIIIPSSFNTIGLTEIENAFQALEGVDPKLIPKYWIQNHYKWIVWKLASYERKFPQYFKDCLSVENIVQHLKYRYEKEIDNAQRPCLRKIFEKDDIPQKRLVLCVSDIIQLYSNKFELLLTDGWYEIRAAIDAPLCQQIYTGRIKVGTKLIIHGAELLNSQDGFHPLQAPEEVRLKITYNSTRRAKWNVKLGYYKDPSPFSIELKSLHKEGGSIGLIKLYIARVYPLKYLEDHKGAKIWRNRKAEEKQAKDFEAENSKMLETIKYEAISEYEQENKTKNLKKNDVSNIPNITCGKTLLNLLDKSNDPENLFSSLSSSQQKSVINCKQNLSMQQQSDVSYRISKKMEEKIMKRNVTPMLKMCVTDVTNCDTSYIFNFWKPTEEVMQMFKEETSFYFYNLIIRQSGELYSTNKTCFKENSSPPVFKKLQRQLLPIAMTVDTYYKPLFNEFDTVGMIVQTTVNSYNQELWLCDFIGRLLFVKIPDGPKLCSLLDNLKRGQTVALINLIMQKPHEEYGRALANQCSVISLYPQQKFLQEGLEIFNQQLPEDLNSLLLSCDTKIEQNLTQIEVQSDSRSHLLKQSTSSYNYLLNDSSEDNSSLPSKITPMDVAMSLLDTDQFL